MYEIINHISQFDETLKTKEEIRLKKEKIGNHEFSIISYMIAMPNTFNSLLSRECRGIVFNEKGEVVSRPFHKFFNIGEKEFTQPNKLKNIIGYSKKIDGSRAIPVLVGNKIIWKTKKSFYSYIAVNINKFYYGEDSEQDIYNPEHKSKPFDTKLDWTIRDLISEDKTPLFEFVSPDNQIVVKYVNTDLVYLNSRDNKSGIYCQMDRTIDNNFNLENFIQRTLLEQEMEGYVLYDNDDFYKLKTIWYIDRHRAMDNISIRELVDLILDNKLDDIIANLYDLGCMERIKTFQKYSEEILNYMLQFEKEAKEKFCLYNCDNLKEYAEKVKKERPPMKAILFSMKRKPEYEITLKNIVSDYFKEKYKNKVIQFGSDE